MTNIKNWLNKNELEINCFLCIIGVSSMFFLGIGTIIGILYIIYCTIYLITSHYRQKKYKEVMDDLIERALKSTEENERKKLFDEISGVIRYY